MPVFCETCSFSKEQALCPPQPTKKRRLADQAAFSGNEFVSASGGDFLALRFQSLLGLGDDGGERGGVLNGEIREDLAVGFDTGGLEAFDEAGVGQTFVTNGGADTSDPEAAELALPLLTVAIFVGHRLPHGVFGVTEELRAETAEAFRTLQGTLATLAAGR